jgi:hypothetical protein
MQRVAYLYQAEALVSFLVAIDRLLDCAHVHAKLCMSLTTPIHPKTRVYGIKLGTNFHYSFVAMRQ